MILLFCPTSVGCCWRWRTPTSALWKPPSPYRHQHKAPRHVLHDNTCPHVACIIEDMLRCHLWKVLAHPHTARNFYHGTSSSSASTRTGWGCLHLDFANASRLRWRSPESSLRTGSFSCCFLSAYLKARGEFCNVLHSSRREICDEFHFMQHSFGTSFVVVITLSFALSEG